MKPIDANGKRLHDQDRVFIYSGKFRHYGTLVFGEYDEIPWSIDYDDGMSFYVVCFNEIFKA